MGIPAQSDYTDEASLLYDVIDDVFTQKHIKNLEDLVEDGKMILSNTISNEEVKQLMTKNNKEDK